MLSEPGGAFRVPLTTILFFGDSITNGQYVERQLIWTALVAEAVKLRHRKQANQLFFVNNSIPGETSRDGLARFVQQCQPMRPDIVTIQFGLNDSNCWATDRGLPRVSPASFRANLSEIIERARWFGAREIILSTNHRPLRDDPLLDGRTLAENNRRYNELVREVASSTRVRLCDIEAAFEPLDPAELLLPYPDLLHLSVKGHQAYAAAILPSIEAALAAVRPTEGA
jgi:lysophospholipase L1-like esterase